MYPSSGSKNSLAMKVLEILLVKEVLMESHQDR